MSEISLFGEKAGNTQRKLRKLIRVWALGMEGMERGKGDGWGGGGLASTPQSFEGFQSVHCVLIRPRKASWPLYNLVAFRSRITPCSFAVFACNILPDTPQPGRCPSRAWACVYSDDDVRDTDMQPSETRPPLPDLSSPTPWFSFLSQTTTFGQETFGKRNDSMDKRRNPADC